MLLWVFIGQANEMIYLRKLKNFFKKHSINKVKIILFFIHGIEVFPSNPNAAETLEKSSPPNILKNLSSATMTQKIIKY